MATGLELFITLLVLTCRAFCWFVVVVAELTAGLGEAGGGATLTLLIEVLLICRLDGMLAELLVPTEAALRGVLSTVLIG